MQKRRKHISHSLYKFPPLAKHFVWVPPLPPVFCVIVRSKNRLAPEIDGRDIKKNDECLLQAKIISSRDLKKKEISDRSPTHADLN